MSVKVEVHQADERGNVFTLLEELHWGGITVPAGFESDGASVPRFFWRAVFPRYSFQYLSIMLSRLFLRTGGKANSVILF